LEQRTFFASSFQRQRADYHLFFYSERLAKTMEKGIPAPQRRKDHASKLQIVDEGADIPLVERIQAKERGKERRSHLAVEVRRFFRSFPRRICDGQRADDPMMENKVWRWFELEEIEVSLLL
jgi:hypothetical protein